MNFLLLFWQKVARHCFVILVRPFFCYTLFKLYFFRLLVSKLQQVSVYIFDIEGSYLIFKNVESPKVDLRGGARKSTERDAYGILTGVDFEVIVPSPSCP